MKRKPPIATRHRWWWRRLSLLAAAALALGSASPAPTVRSLAFQGVRSVPESELLSHMITRPPSRWRFWRAKPAFSYGALEEDLERIERVYRDHGYYEAVATQSLAWSPDGRRVSITVHVAEGEPVRVASVDLALAHAIALPDGWVTALDWDLPLKSGAIFTVRDYKATRDAVLSRLTDAGRPAARLEGGAEVDVATREARIRWKVDPGPEVHFGPIEISGLERVGEEVVERELRIHPGELYSGAALDRARRRLLALQLFRYVAVGPVRRDAQSRSWPVAIELRERPPRSVAVGAGWDSNVGPRGSLRFSHRNFLGDGRRFEAGGSASELEQGARASFLQPYFAGTRATLESDLTWRRLSRNAYDANEVAWTLGPRRRFGEYWVGEANYRFGWSGVSNVTENNEEVLRKQKSNGLLSGVGTRWRRAELDDPTNPRRGTWFELGVATNQRALGSDFDWMRYDAEARAYWPVGPTVLAARVRGRVIDPFAGTQPAEVPLWQRLFLGGAHDGRGFAFQKLGPLESDGDPVGGTSSVFGSVEWRIPVWRRFGIASFVDAGQVSLDPFELASDDFGVGVGAGLTVDTPVGPLALYAGYPVREVETSRRWRFYISVGHGF